MPWRAISCRCKWNIRQMYNTTYVEWHASANSKISCQLCDGRLTMARLAGAALQLQLLDCRRRVEVCFDSSEGR